jgi:hypothetical protein
MKTKADSRKFQRNGCFVPVDGKEGTPFDGLRTVDISSGGVGFVAPKSLAVNQKIAVELELSPEGEPVLVVGEVKWVTKLSRSGKYRVGMSFLNGVNEDSADRLKKHFRK